MKQFLHFVCVLAHLHMLTAKQYANVNIHGGSLKVINYNSETSKDLLGVTFYQGLPALKDHNKLKMFRDELGVNTVSFAQTATEMLFPTSGWRWNCCNNVNDLRKLIWSGEACRNFANSYTPSIFADPFFVSTGITPFIMVRDVCAPDNPATRHCVKPMTDWQSGIPLNGDGWWTELLSAYVTCALKVRKDLKYFHLWNEPNAFFQQTDKKYDGKYFTNFYQDVVTKIKREHPQILMGGPVTWNIAAYQDDWENWWVPFLDRTLTSNPRTLDFFDWHCYDHGGDNQQAEWDVVVAMSESISLYAGLKYGQYLKNSITETNYKLKDWENSNRATNFKRRSIMNAKQVVGLSHIPDKFDKRLIYDAHAKGWEWLDSPEFQSQKVLKYLLGRKLVDFEVQHDNTKPSNRQGTFFNQDIMTQVVYDTKQKKSYTVIVNDNENEEVVVTLTDLDKKYRFQNPAKMAKLNGNNVDFGIYWIGTSNEKAYITMKPKSVAVVDANVISTPQQTVTQQEFRSGLDCMMKKISWQGSWTCGITIWKSGNNPRRAKLKMGLFYGAFGYKWDIKAELNNQVLLDTKNFVPVLRYNEFPISAAAFKKTGWMKVSFTMRNNKNGWIPPARLGYVAATVDYA